MHHSSTCLALALALSAGCAKPEKTATVQGPPLTVAPVQARFVTLTAPPPTPPPLKATPQPPQVIEVAPCTEALVTPVQGTAVAEEIVAVPAATAGQSGLSTAHAETLAEGDVFTVTGVRSFALHGQGVVVLAQAALTGCDAGAPAKPSHHVVRATQAPELTFLHGAMHAHLDVDDHGVAPSIYLGRLSGTGDVAEHAHPGSWEVLCAVQAAGTFTIAGKAERLGPMTCLAVPPNTPHAWQPDPGSTLVAVQMYAPPGPEQRFRTMAAEEEAASHEASPPH